MSSPDDVEVRGVDDADSTTVFEGVHLAQLVAGDRTSVQHYRIEPGAVIDEHSHEQEQTGYLVEGRLEFVVGDDEYEVGAGDSYVVAGGVPHVIKSVGETDAVGVDIFSPPRPNPPSTDGS